MRNWLAKIRVSPRVMRSLLMLAVLVGASVAAFFWGRLGGAPQLGAQQPGGSKFAEQTPLGNSDYERRVVAYIYGNVPITRAELGEYLIARFGAERVEFLVNRRIVDMECKAKGIYITDAEVEAQFQEDLKGFGPGITVKDFTNNILKRFNKTLFDWKEDVIRPKLALHKLCRPTVVVGDKDLYEAFEARYGPQVQCRMIVIQKDSRHRFDIHKRASQSEEGFHEQAKQQFLPNLAAQAGAVPAIHKHFGDPDLERIAFGLKVGEVSELKQMSDGTYVILKCDRHIPANPNKRFEEERMALDKEIREIKLAQEIPKAFAKLRDAARPEILLRASPQMSDAEVTQAAQRDLGLVPRSQSPELKK